MGIGGFLAAQAEGAHYAHVEASTHARLQRSCEGEISSEVLDILEPYGVPPQLAEKVAEALQQAERRRQEESRRTKEAESTGLTPFLLRLGQGLEPVEPTRSLRSALNIGASYAVGGLVSTK